MPQTRRVQRVQKGAWAGGLGRITGNLINMQMQKLNQERESREEILSTLKEEAKWTAEAYGKEGPEYQNIAKEILAEMGGTPRLSPLQQQRSEFVRGIGPTVTGYRGFEQAGAPTGPPPPVSEEALASQRAQQMGWPTPAEKARAEKARAEKPISALRARLITLYDREKKKAAALDIKIKGMQETLPEPKPGFLGIFDNQDEIDFIQDQIDTYKETRAKIKSNMEGIVSEGKKRFGEDIIFGIPGKGATAAPAAPTPEDMSKMSPEEILREMLKATKQ